VLPKQLVRCKLGIKLGVLLVLLPAVLLTLGGCALIDEWFDHKPPSASADNNPPIVVIESSTTSGTAPLTVTFNASSSYDPDGDTMVVTWLFGDGYRSNEIAPTHTYTVGGSFTVTLLVEDEKGASASDSIEIQVVEPPLPPLSEAVVETDQEGKALVQLGDLTIPVKVSASSTTTESGLATEASSGNPGSTDLRGLTIQAYEIGDQVVFIVDDDNGRFYPTVHIEKREVLAERSLPFMGGAHDDDRTEWVLIGMLAVVDPKKAAIQVTEKAAIELIKKGIGEVSLNYVRLSFTDNADEIIRLSTTGVRGRFLLLWPNTLGALDLMDDVDTGTLYSLAWYGGFDRSLLYKLRSAGKEGLFVYASRKGEPIQGTFSLIGIFPSGEITAIPSQGPAPLDVSFRGEINVPGGAPETTIYEWNFGDKYKISYPGNEQPSTVKHVYREPGHFDVKLRVTSLIQRFGQEYALTSELKGTVVVSPSGTFSAGELVKVCDTGDSGLNMRESPAGNIYKTVPDGWLLKVVDGPKSADLEGKTYVWWKVREEHHEPSPIEGWVVEDFIKKCSPESLVPKDLPDYFTAGLQQVDKAIRWAVSQEGKTKWCGYCLRFVADAYRGKLPKGWDSPEDAKENLGTSFYPASKNYNPPRGALIFFSAYGKYCDAPYECIDLADYGHIGIYLGDGKVVHAFGSVKVQDVAEIVRLSGRDSKKNQFGIGSYVGWAYPPREWLEGTDQSVVLPAPQLREPEDGAIGVPTRPTFRWSAVPGANKYWLLVAKAPEALPSDPNATDCPQCTCDTYVTTTQYTLPSELELDTTYYWRVQAFDDSVSPIKQGEYSQIWSFTTRSSGNQDLPPIVASANQYKADGVTAISEGTTTNESTVIFKGTVSDPDGDRVKLEIELRQITEAFTGAPTWQSELVPSGTEVSWARGSLVNAGYKWQYRAVDEWGQASPWQEFGTTGNTDFKVEVSTNVTLTLYVHEGGQYGPVIVGARVQGHDAAGNPFDKTTNSSGYVTITGAPGTWHFEVSKSGYHSKSWDWEITKTESRHAFLEQTQQRNQPPVIEALTATPSTVEPGGQSRVSVSAHDPEGDPLTYSWSASGGRLSSTTGPGDKTWTAPSTPGTYQVTVSVTDNKPGHSPIGRSVELIVEQSSRVTAEIIGYSPSSRIEVDPGESFTLRFTFRNTGNTAWDFWGGYTIWDANGNVVQDRWSSSSQRVQPNQQGSFQWQTSLSDPGEYWVQFGVWKSRGSGLLHAAPSSPQNLIQVVAPTTVAATITGYQPTTKIQVDPGESFTLRFTFRNTGNTAWDFWGGYTIWDANGNVVQDRWSSSSQRVQPNQQGSFQWQTSLSDPGEYWLQFGVWKSRGSGLLHKAPSPYQNLIKVTGLTVGTRVRVTQNLNVRTGPGLQYPEIEDPDYLGYAPAGALGTVIGGPSEADGYIWWKIQYDAGFTGWSVENGLEPL